MLVTLEGIEVLPGSLREDGFFNVKFSDKKITGNRKLAAACFELATSVLWERFGIAISKGTIYCSYMFSCAYEIFISYIWSNYSDLTRPHPKM